MVEQVLGWVGNSSTLKVGVRCVSDRRVGKDQLSVHNACALSVVAELHV